MKKLISAFILSVVLVGCGSSSGGGGGYLSDAEIFVDNLNWEDPYDIYWLAKEHTLQGPDYIVVEVGFGEYYAFDLWTLQFYGSDLAAFWSEAIPAFYIGDGIYEDIYGNWYNKSSEQTEDLETMGGILEKKQNQELTDQIVADYGLSEDRAGSLAQLVRDYQQLGESRELTEADAKAFLDEALGIDVKEAKQEYEKMLAGKKNDLQGFIDLAAQKNGIVDPEHKSVLMNRLLNQ